MLTCRLSPSSGTFVTSTTEQLGGTHPCIPNAKARISPILADCRGREIFRSCFQALATTHRDSSHSNHDHYDFAIGSNEGAERLGLRSERYALVLRLLIITCRAQVSKACRWFVASTKRRTFVESDGLGLAGLGGLAAWRMFRRTETYKNEHTKIKFGTTRNTALRRPSCRARKFGAGLTHDDSKGGSCAFIDCSLNHYHGVRPNIIPPLLPPSLPDLHKSQSNASNPFQILTKSPHSQLLPFTFPLILLQLLLQLLRRPSHLLAHSNLLMTFFLLAPLLQLRLGRIRKRLERLCRHARTALALVSHSPTRRQQNTNGMISRALMQALNVGCECGLAIEERL